MMSDYASLTHLMSFDKNMFEIFAIISGIIAGVCLMAIAVRKKMPLIGTIRSPKLKKDLDAVDKKLALAALFFFFLFIVLIIIFFE